MGRFVNLYRTQIELLWHWRLGRAALLKRAIVALVALAHRVQHHGLAAARPLHINELGGGLVAVLFIAALNLLVRPVHPRPRGQPLGRRAGHPDPALPGVRHLAARPVRPGGHRSPAASSARSSSRSSSASSPAPSACCSGWARTTPTTARSCGRSRADGRTSSAPTTRASSSSSSTACRMTCCPTRCAPVGCPRWPAGSGPAPTSWATGTRCCPRRRRPARRASCTATTTASPTSAGGRRRTGSSWWPTTPRTRPRSSGASPTARGCSARAARASATSSRATATAPSW